MTADDPGLLRSSLVAGQGVIRFDRRLALQTAMLALLFCWPLLLIGRPAYFSDTAPYYKGGRAAVAYLEHKFIPASRSRAVPDGVAPVGQANSSSDADVRGARSIPYSLTAFLLRGPRAAMIPLVILQALLVAFTIAIFLTGLDLVPFAWWTMALLLAFATPAAWFTSYAMPDIFAGVTIIAIATLTIFADRLTRPVAITLALAGGFAIATHPSHVALAIVLLPLAWYVRADRGGHARRAALWLAAPVLLGIAAVVISGFVGFGEVSLAPKRFPLTLAHAIAGGPARWYLDAHCRDRHYAICKLYPNGFPATGDMMWGPDGIGRRASPAQMDRIRSEEREILLAAAAAYPARQASELIGETARQLVKFDVDEASFNLRTVTWPDGSLNLTPDLRLPTGTTMWANLICRVSAAAATMALIPGLVLARGWRRMLALLLLAGLVANAAICAILSGADDRYQARVIWLLPLAAIAAWSAHKRLAANSGDDGAT